MSKWLNNAVFYEIYPQTFYDSNGDGIGDIPGIIEKLDYIRELGCNAIWMNPCYLSPFDDAGYDVQDYCTVAPRYGTNSDLVRLFHEVHKRDMHIILDLVPGHTSYLHPWFQESKKPEKNEFTDRYVWTNSVWEAPDQMQWLRGISQRDGSVALNFFSTQPALNYGFYQCDCSWMQPMAADGPRATVKALKDIMRFWLAAGCDGFRVDMAGSLVKNDNENSTGIITLWKEFRSFLDQEFPDAAMVSEWGEPDKSLESGFHMDFLLHFGPSHYNDLFRCDEPYFSSRGKGDISEFLATYQKNYDKTGGNGLICIPSGNHDMDRLAKHLTPDEMKIAFAFLLSMPGAPFLYYGDEIGMRYIENLTSVEGGYGRTGSRSPMQWNRALNAGFSAAPKDKLYIPIDAANDRPDVESQRKADDTLLCVVKQLIALRMSHSALQSRGKLEFLTTSGYPLVYRRSDEHENILVVINPSATPAKISLASSFNNCIFTLGGSAIVEDGAMTVSGGTAAFFQE